VLCPSQRSYSMLSHLCWGLLLNHDPAATWVVSMAEYSVYSDDSGHPDDQPFVVAAGYVGSEAQWLAFEPQWKAALARHGLGDVFHMTDFMRKNRSVKARKPVLDDLEAIVRANQLVPVSGAVEIAGYKKVNEVFVLEETLGTPYALAARAMAISVNKWKSENFRDGDHLLLFTESGTKHRGDMAEVFKRDKLPEPIPVLKSMVAVQPADILAWELFRFLKEEQRVRRRLRRLAEIRPEYHTVFRQANLIETCQQVKVMLRSKLPPTAQISFQSSPKRLRRRSIK
jgi:hypothetical protein